MTLRPSILAQEDVPSDGSIPLATLGAVLVLVALFIGLALLMRYLRKRRGDQ